MERAQISSGVAPSANSRSSASTGTGRNPLRRSQRLAGSPSDSRRRRRSRASQAVPLRFVEEAPTASRLWCETICVRIELGVHVIVEQVAHLRRRVAVGVRPAAECQCLLMGVGSIRAAARRGPRSAAGRRTCRRRGPPAPRNPCLMSAIGVRQAIVERVLAGQERDRRTERGTSVPRLMTRCRRLSSSLQADRAVGQENERPLARQAPHPVVGIDPRVHARRGVSSSARGGRSSAAMTCCSGGERVEQRAGRAEAIPQVY